MSDRLPLILLVEDDPAHTAVIRSDLSTSHITTRLTVVSDIRTALNYLFRLEDFSDPERSPQPDLLLIDTRLPLLDVFDILKAVKSSENLSQTPVVMLTSSAAGNHESSYAYQANSNLVKPSEDDRFGELIASLGYYWVNWGQDRY